MKRWVVGIILAVLVAIMIGLEWSRSGKSRAEALNVPGVEDVLTRSDEAAVESDENVRTTAAKEVLTPTATVAVKNPAGDGGTSESVAAQSLNQNANGLPAMFAGPRDPSGTMIFFIHSRQLFPARNATEAERAMLERTLAEVVTELGGNALVLDADFNADKGRPTLLYGRDAYDLTEEIRRRLFFVADNGR